MNLNEFLTNPIVKITIHVVIILGLTINIFHLYSTWQLKTTIEQRKTELSNIEEKLNQRNYYESDLYKEKYIKERSFKKRGEEVIDTSSLEDSGDIIKPSYIPDPRSEEKSNVEKWINCFFGEDRDTCINS
jgi:hypothetical protein